MGDSFDLETYRRPIDDGSGEDLLLEDSQISCGALDLPLFPAEYAYEAFKDLLQRITPSIFCREGLLSCALLLSKLSSVVPSKERALVIILRTLRLKRLLPLDDDLRQAHNIAISLAGLAISQNPDTTDDPRRKRIVWLGREGAVEEFPGIPSTRRQPPSRHQCAESVGSEKSSLSINLSSVLSDIPYTNFRNGCFACRHPRNSDASANPSELPGFASTRRTDVNCTLVGPSFKAGVRLGPLSDSSASAAAPLCATNLTGNTTDDKFEFRDNAAGELARPLRPSLGPLLMKKKHKTISIDTRQSKPRPLSLASSAFNVSANRSHTEIHTPKPRPCSIYSPPIVVKRGKAHSSSTSGSCASRGSASSRAVAHDTPSKKLKRSLTPSVPVREGHAPRRSVLSAASSCRHSWRP